LENLYVLPVLLFSIIVHEIAHGWTALRLGDPTAHDAGRLTFNPIPHIDPIGSIAIPLLSMISSGSIFIAWAKPVPVNPLNFNNLRRDEVLVSVMGPLSNLVVALICTLAYIFLKTFVSPYVSMDSEFQRSFFLFLIQMFFAGITLNIFLAVFNLIPVPPLDGSYVLTALLPQQFADKLRQIGFFGILIVIMLMRVPIFRQTIVSIVLTIRIPYDLLILAFK
jgi:Zn-dependent protease